MSALLQVMGGRSGGSISARQPGAMPPTMSQASMAAVYIRVQRQAGDGSWFSIASGASVRPNEAIRLVYGGWGIGNYIVELSIIAAANGAIVWGPVQDPILLGGGDRQLLAPPGTTLTGYSAIATTVSTPLPFMDKPQVAFAFFVDPAAAAPPVKPPPDTGFLGQLSKLIIPVAIVAGLVVLSPTINRIGSRTLGD